MREGVQRERVDVNTTPQTCTSEQCVVREYFKHNGHPSIFKKCLIIYRVNMIYNGIGVIKLLRKPSCIIIFNFPQISETKGKSRKSRLYALDSSIVNYLNLQFEKKSE